MSRRQSLAPVEWFSADELAGLKLPGIPSTKRGVQQLIGREGWQSSADFEGRPLCRKRAGRGGGFEYHIDLLPEAAKARLMAAPRAEVVDLPDRESVWMKWERIPLSMREEAERRLAIIARVESLERAGLAKDRAVEEVVSQAAREAKAGGAPPPFSKSTVYGWFRRIAGVRPDDRAAYLAPDYAGRAETAPCDGAAFDKFKEYFLTQSKPPLAAAYRWLERKAEEEAWTVPSLKTLQRKLDAEIPRNVQAYLRHGDSALDHSFPHLDRDRSSIVPMQIGNLDGHTWDNEVEWPDGTRSRPLSVAVQDIASGKILAIRFDRTLNRHLVRLALADTFRDFGLFDTLLMDNGRENSANDISGGQSTRWRWKIREDEPAGLLKLLGVKAVFATPYWGQAKPIERAFRNFAHDIAKHPEFVGSYVGHHHKARPENAGSHAPPIAAFEARVRAEIVAYNAQLGRRGAGMNGRSFDQVFEAGIQRRPLRRVSPEQLRLCLLASLPVAMDGKSGAVKVMGSTFWSPAMAGMKRQKVIVRFDPENLALPVHIYSQDGRYLVEAQMLAAGSFDNAQQAQAHNRARREYAKLAKRQASLLRKMNPVDAGADIPMPVIPAAPDPKVVSLEFAAPRKADQLGQPDPNEAWERGVAAVHKLG